MQYNLADYKFLIKNNIVKIVENTTFSTTQIASTGQKTVHRVYEKHKLQSYKLKWMHPLSDDDLERRLEFCENITTRIDRKPDDLKKIALVMNVLSISVEM